MNKGKRNKFSIEEKERIVLSILEAGSDSYHLIARELNTSHRLIFLWAESYKAHGRSGLSLKNDLSYTGAINELRRKHSLSVLLNVAGMARSSFYYHMKQLKAKDKYSNEKKIVTEIFHQNKGRYGYRRIVLELNNIGVKLNHKTVYRLMDAVGLKCKVRMNKYRSYRGESGKIAPNILEGDLKANKPNQKWATDITEFSLFGKKSYLSPIIDLYNGEIVSYNIAYRPTLDLVVDMVDTALDKVHDNTNLILHSDQGWHYQHPNYQKRLNKERGSAKHVP